MQIAEPLLIAIEELSKLPSVGKKTAQRLAMYLLKSNGEQFESLIKALEDLKSKIKFCKRCFNLAEEELCIICKSTKRDGEKVCVV